MWVLMLVCSIIVARLIQVLSKVEIDSVLKWFFKLNMIIIFVQYLSISIKQQSIIPFFSYMGAGDFLKGIFTNSSVNMIVLSFYLIYFIYKKNMKFTIFSILGIVFTTYMSGIVLLLGTSLLFAFFYLSFKNKMKILIGTFIGIILFSIISPGNVNYVKSNLTKKLFAKSDQARKIVSFEQTIDYATSSTSNFLIGAGGGKFSSRTAFMTAGDYVNWFPQNYVYRSEAFSKNHFTLWNSKILSRPYKDGTANQPFSFYNKIIVPPNR